jgi:hypothetical protein
LALPALDPASGHYTCYASAAGPCPFYDQVLWTDASPPYAATVTQFNFDPQHVPDGAAGQSTATLLLLDQSARIKVRNPPEHVATRRSAAQHFGWSVWRNLDGPLFHQVAVAGFAGPGGDPALPLRLPATPVWAPQGGPAFSAEAPVLESAIDTLVPLVGGSAPVFEALQAAISATASHVPASRRAVVAWLGGGDESGLSAQQQQQVLAALRQQQTDTGVQVMLIDNGNPDAAQLAAITELASALRAPRIRGEASGAAELAARLLSGGKVPVLNIVFRLQAPPGTFQAGTKLHGMLSAVDRYEGPIGGWAEIYLPFAAEIP